MNRRRSILFAIACLCIIAIQLSIQAIDLSSGAQINDLPHEPVKISDSKLRSLAEKITVRVFPEKSLEDRASGILIDKQEQKQGQQSVYLYLVLTNDHVLEILKERAKALGGGYKVQTYDNKIYDLFLYEANFRGNDLGLLWFYSDRNYEKAAWGQAKSLKEYTDRVYVAGFPCGTDSCKEGFTFTSGRAATSFIVSGKPLDAGYQLGFSNDTREGMSGGPILDESGRLVGINGRGKNQERVLFSGEPTVHDNPYAYMDGTQPPPETQGFMKHFAWGIPIETYLKLAPIKPFEQIKISSQKTSNAAQLGKKFTSLPLLYLLGIVGIASATLGIVECCKQT